MAESMHGSEFSFNGVAAGYFEDAMLPSSAGRYRYMPYRSVGHFEMGREVGRGLRPKCTFLGSHGDIYSFAVVELPEYGVIEIEAPNRQLAKLTSE